MEGKMDWEAQEEMVEASPEEASRLSWCRRPKIQGCLCASDCGAVVIAVFVTHTTLTELVLARTLGKAIVGLRTTTLTGTRPKAWQLLVRGLLKSLDLLPGAWLLLLLPVNAPHRQRLGDLVGRTVVVTDVPPESEDGQDESDQSLGD